MPRGIRRYQPFRLVIVDSIMALFRVDFSGRGELAERQQKLGQMMSRLQKIAEEFNVAVFVTNHVCSDPSGGLTFVQDPKKVATCLPFCTAHCFRLQPTPLLSFGDACHGCGCTTSARSVSLTEGTHRWRHTAAFHALGAMRCRRLQPTRLSMKIEPLGLHGKTESYDALLAYIPHKASCSAPVCSTPSMHSAWHSTCVDVQPLLSVD